MDPNPDESSPSSCPACGAPMSRDAVGGFCPKCLMAAAMVPTDPAAATVIPPIPPEELAPHFPQLEILECLGRGGMGVVYKARQRSLNRLVALKLLAPERAGDPAFAARFEREAQALAALNHPHIVGVHDFGRAGGFFYLLMEFVDGVNLRQLLQAKRLSPKEALSIVPPVCEALQCAHDRGIVHRDIKPENLLIDKTGAVKIADFGIAKMVAGEPDDPAKWEGDGADASASVPLGSPDYAAPEQVEGNADHRADIYSLGVVLYEMLTGERPTEKFEAPSKRVLVDVRIDEIVLRALEREPEMRYATAAEFRETVESVTRPKEPSSVRSGPGAELAAWRGLWHAPLWVLAFLYTGLLTFLFGTASQLPRQVALHFNTEGWPDRWGARDSHLLLVACLPVAFVAMFVLLAWLTPRFPRLANLPRRDYWLAPGRLRFTGALLLRWLLWLSCLLTVFFGVLHWITVEAHRAAPPRLPFKLFLPALMGFVAGLVLWIGVLMMRFAEADRYAQQLGAGAPTGKQGGDSPVSAKGWLRTLAWGMLALSLPAFALGVFLLVARASESGGWHPTPQEALVVPLTWIAMFLLPVATVALFLASRRVGHSPARGAPATPEGRTSRHLVWPALVLLAVLIPSGVLIRSWQRAKAVAEKEREAARSEHLAAFAEALRNMDDGGLRSLLENGGRKLEDTRRDFGEGHALTDEARGELRLIEAEIQRRTGKVPDPVDPGNAARLPPPQLDPAPRTTSIA